MDTLIFIIGVFLLISSLLLSYIIETVENLDYKYYLILKVAVDGLMLFGILIMIVSYGIFLYENVKF